MGLFMNENYKLVLSVESVESVERESLNEFKQTN